MPVAYRNKGNARASVDAWNRANRLEQFEGEMRRHPGAAPNGTGSTGLMSGDARGYSELLNRQKQYVDDVAAENGRGPVNVRYGGVMPTPNRRPSLDAFDEPSVGGTRRSVNASLRDAQRERIDDDLALESLFSGRRSNDRATASNALFESESLPYGTPADRTSADIARKRTVGDFTRAESGRDQDQMLAEFFNPVNQGRMDNLQRRDREDLTHKAGEERTTLFGRDRMQGMADVGVAEATAAGKTAVADKDAMAEMFRNPAIADALRDPNHPLHKDAVEVFQREFGVGAGAAGGVDPSKVASRADVEQFARENRRNPADVMRELQAQGYVIR